MCTHTWPIKLILILILLEVHPGQGYISDLMPGFKKDSLQYLFTKIKSKNYSTVVAARSVACAFDLLKVNAFPEKSCLF